MSERYRFITVDAVDVFENVDDWSFDVFRINEAGEGHALKYVGYELLQRYNLISKFKVCLSHIAWRQYDRLSELELNVPQILAFCLLFTVIVKLHVIS